MMRGILTTLALTLMSFGLPEIAQAEILTIAKERSIRIHGGIGGSILTQAKQLDKLSAAGKDPIYIHITSPGGSIMAGLQFVSAMERAQARGAELHCLADVIAASMAFQIFIECDYRYAYRYSLLLWHAPRVSFGMGGSATPRDMESLLEELRRLEARLVPPLLERLAIPRDVFYYHYHQETLWLAEDLLQISPDLLTLVQDARYE